MKCAHKHEPLASVRFSTSEASVDVTVTAVVPVFFAAVFFAAVFFARRVLFVSMDTRMLRDQRQDDGEGDQGWGPASGRW